MIYTVFEAVATLADCFILFGFMIYTLSFQSINTHSKWILTVIFSICMIANITALNHLSTLEGILSVSYLIILFMFSVFALQGKWWYKLTLSLIGLAVIFLTNTIISVVSALILKKELSYILVMQNPLRIINLILSKLFSLCLLIPFANSVHNQKMKLNLSQSIISIIALIISIIVGSEIEKMLSEHYLPIEFAVIILLSLSAITTLLFIILLQFSAQNEAVAKQSALEARLQVENEKLHETLQWSKSVRTLSHDLDNHMIAISEFIKSGEDSKALAYIEKISAKHLSAPKFTETNNRALNAILDLKRMTCQHENIDLKCYIETNIGDIDETAFSAIFGNLMDNAIEAERSETHKEIRISIEMKGDYLHITVQNRIHKPVLINGQIPNTTKKDKAHHGLGIESITETIAQKGGAITFEETADWFIANVLMLARVK